MPEEGRLDNMYRPTDSKYPNRGKTESPFANSSKVLDQMGLSDIDIANATYEAKRDLAYKGGWKPDREGNPKNDVNHFLINKSLDNLKKGYFMETDVESPVNKEWAEDLGYQLFSDGVPEEAIPELLEIFKSEAPSWEEAHQKQNDQKALNDLGAKMDKLEENSKNEKFAPNDYSTEFTQQEIDDFLKTIDNKTDSFPQGDPTRKKKVFVNKEEKDAFMKSLPESAEVMADEFDHTWEDENGKPDRWLTYWEVYYNEPNDKQNNSKVLNQMGLDDEDFGDSNGSNQVSPSRSSDDIESDNEYAENQKYFNVNGNWTNELEGLKTGLSGQELSDYLKQGLEKRGISDLFVDDYNPNDNMVNFVATDNQGYKVTGWYDRNTGRLGLKANNHQGKDDRWYQDKLGEMGFGDSNGSNKGSWSSVHNPTPEQEKQLNEIVNSVFPGRDWKYIADNTDSPRDIMLGIQEFLETGHSEYLLNVLKTVKKRYDEYGIRI